MVRERIKELVDFATSESPYSNANKGWINDDVYVQFGALPDQPEQSKDELLDVFVFWEPIKKLITILFFVVLFASCLVFTSVSFTRGRVDISFLFSKSLDQSNQVAASKQFELPQPPSIEDQITPEDLEVASELKEVEILPEIISTPSQSENISLKDTLETSTKSEVKKELGTAGNLF